MSNHITILGCGASAGTPLIGCNCATCTSPNPKNNRTRVSVLVQIGDTRILIDTSPDLRQQALRQKITTVDAILYTHDHADHTHGIDDIRSFNFHRNNMIPAYGDAHTLASLQHRFAYVFQPPMPQYGWFRPALEAHIIQAGKPFSVEGISVLPLAQKHGKHDSLGFRIGNFAYSTDTNFLPEESFDALQGLDVWVVDCLRYDPAPTHAHLELALQWIARVKPKRAILTHMSHVLEYDALCQSLPVGVEPAYDGQAIAFTLSS